MWHQEVVTVIAVAAASAAAAAAAVPDEAAATGVVVVAASVVGALLGVSRDAEKVKLTQKVSPFPFGPVRARNVRGLGLAHINRKLFDR